MLKNKIIRIIVEDQEEVVYWDEDVNMDIFRQMILYVTEDIRKLYKANELTYKNYGGTEFKLDDIITNNITPVFVSIANRSDVNTEHKVDPRRFKNLYIFTNKNMIRIQRFEGVRRFEEGLMTFEDLRDDNESSARIRFDTPLNQNSNKPKIDIVHTEPVKPKEIKLQETKTVKSAGLQIQTNNNNSVNNKSRSPSTSGGDSGLLKPQDGGADRSYQTGKNMVGHGRSPSGFMIESKNAKPIKEEQGLKNYTMDEIKQHNTPRDGWMVLNGKVYDVSKYIAYHPGGSIINKGLGKDATVLFNQYHSWVNANHILEKYHIGFYKK